MTADPDAIGGIVPPILGAWTQNLIFGVIGAFLLWRVDRR